MKELWPGVTLSSMYVDAQMSLFNRDKIMGLIMHTIKLQEAYEELQAQLEDRRANRKSAITDAWVLYYNETWKGYGPMAFMPAYDGAMSLRGSGFRAHVVPHAVAVNALGSLRYSQGPALVYNAQGEIETVTY